jgi:DnaK suppressor protein
MISNSISCELRAMNTLTQKELKNFKQVLTQQLAELLATAEQTVSSMVQPGDWASDPLDQAAIEDTRAYTLRIRDRESHLIKKISGALAKIDEGTFGICEACGEEISLARLTARPVTAFCIQCKTRMEALEKATG